MCHPEVPAGQPTPEVAREETSIPLPSGEAMPALLTRPEGGAGPAVLIVHDIFGRGGFYEHLAARLATAGFVALLPDFFFRQGPLHERSLESAFKRRALLDEIGALENLSAACDFVQAQAGVSGRSRLGSLGFCMGGTLALNLAARRTDLATVCYYGYVSGEAHTSARLAPSPIDEVDRLTGPIIGFWGDHDQQVNLADIAPFAAELERRGITFEYTIYPGLEHGFMARSALDPNHPAYRLACESWTRALDFFRQHLAHRRVLS